MNNTCIQSTSIYQSCKLNFMYTSPACPSNFYLHGKDRTNVISHILMAVGSGYMERGVTITVLQVDTGLEVQKQQLHQQNTCHSQTSLQSPSHHHYHCIHILSFQVDLSKSVAISAVRYSLCTMCVDEQDTYNAYHNTLMTSLTGKMEWS